MAAGKLTITVRKATGLAIMDHTGTSDPYVVVKVGEQEPRRTSVIEKTLSPVWDHSVSFEVAPALDEAIELEVWDKDLTVDDFMGQLQVRPAVKLVKKGC